MTPPVPEPVRPAAPTCYRHDDRRTLVRCVRCDRPICGECQHAASVGFQCPDDVAEGRRSQRAARTLAGGRAGAPPGQVTTVLVGVLVAVFLLQLAAGPVVQLRFGLQPLAVAAGEPHRLVTAAFLHAGLLHLGFNAIALLALGPQLEAALGRLRYGVLYGLAALGGSVASYVANDPRVLGVGASGAVYGVLGGLLVVARRERYDVRGLAVLLGLNLVLGFVVPAIDWRAHLGGLATGAVLTAALLGASRDGRRDVAQATAVAGLGVLLLGLAALRTAVLTAVG